MLILNWSLRASWACHFSGSVRRGIADSYLARPPETFAKDRPTRGDCIIKTPGHDTCHTNGTADDSGRAVKTVLPCSLQYTLQRNFSGVNRRNRSFVFSWLIWQLDDGCFISFISTFEMNCSFNNNARTLGLIPLPR